jgi:Putative Actinobacterial Holin-X, holin superfamily III
LSVDPKEQPDSIAAALTEVTERVTALVHDEIELAKAEIEVKVKGLVRGGVAVGAGAVFGLFAVIVGVGTLCWGLNSLFSSLWLGFLVTFVLLIALTAGAFVFAWRKFKVGAPTPTMAIDEAKKIRATVTTSKPELKA